MANAETAVLFEEIARLNQEIAQFRQRGMAMRIELADWREGRRVNCAACHGTGTNCGVFPMRACVVCCGDGSLLTEAAKHEDAALAEMEGG